MGYPWALIVVPQVGVHLFEAGPTLVVVLQWILLLLEDALGFSQKPSAVGSVSPFGWRSTIVAWGFVHRLVHPGGSIIGPILPHLEKVRAATEKDILSGQSGA